MVEVYLMGRAWECKAEALSNDAEVLPSQLDVSKDFRVDSLTMIYETKGNEQRSPRLMASFAAYSA